jgi:hypothetical protein
VFISFLVESAVNAVAADTSSSKDGHVSSDVSFSSSMAVSLVLCSCSLSVLLGNPVAEVHPPASASWRAVQ